MSAVSRAILALVITTSCMLAKSLLADTASSQLILSSKAGIAVVRGSSMLPSLRDGDKVKIRSVLADTSIFGGQLVLVSFKGRDRRMVKRVFAVPSDTLFIHEGKMLLNSEVVRPQGWPQGYEVPNKTALALRAQLTRYQGRIPSNQYVIFGDNPLNSQDSLDYGMVSRAQITATVQKFNLGQ